MVLAVSGPGSSLPLFLEAPDISRHVAEVIVAPPDHMNTSAESLHYKATAKMQINPAGAVTPAVLEFISQDNCKSTWPLEHCRSRVVLVGRKMPCRRALYRVAGAPCSSPAYHLRQRLCALYQEASLPALGSGLGFCGAASSQPQAAHRLWQSALGAGRITASLPREGLPGHQMNGNG